MKELEILKWVYISIGLFIALGLYMFFFHKKQFFGEKSNKYIKNLGETIHSIGHDSQKGGESFQKTIQIGSPILLIIGIAAFISFIVVGTKHR